MKNSFWSGVLTGVVGLVVVGVAAGLIVMFTGAFNVAATDPHSTIVRGVLDATMENSIAARATPLPASYSADLMADGAHPYKEYCAHCHGAPGVERDIWSKGMLPDPPDLTEAAGEWSPEEIHWIIENGIKMTGMPAFGPYHEEKELLALTAFVKALPGMSAEQYAAATAGDGGE